MNISLSGCNGHKFLMLLEKYTSLDDFKASVILEIDSEISLTRFLLLMMKHFLNDLFLKYLCITLLS